MCSPKVIYEAIISPLFRWPKLVCHYIEDEGNLRLKSVEIESNELGEFKSDSFDIVRGLDESALSCVKSYLTDFSRVSFISAERI
ncbi:hypothetical protein EAY27_24300, partial [Vibrio anguillarum]|nr:hypothetical protein [Vibrio anguillarum]